VAHYSMKNLKKMIPLFFLSATIALHADTIVFKNGNCMEVQDLAIGKGCVMYTIRGMAVTVPLRYIDLDETEKANAEINAQRQKEKEEEKLRIEQEAEHSLYEPFSLEQLATRSLYDKKVHEIIDQWKKKQAPLKTRFAGNESLSPVDPTHSGRFLIPFHQHGGVMVIQTLVNGRVKMPFIFDTGASVTTISTTLAEQAGVEIDSSVSVPVLTANGKTTAHIGAIKSLIIGDLKAVNVPVLVVKDTQANLLGQNLISMFDVTINYSRNIIALKHKK